MPSTWKMPYRSSVRGWANGSRKLSDQLKQLGIYNQRNKSHGNDWQKRGINMHKRTININETKLGIEVIANTAALETNHLRPFKRVSWAVQGSKS